MFGGVWQPALELDLAIVYGSTYGRTEDAALRIAEQLGARLGLTVPVFDVGASGVGELAAHDVVIVGGSTWNGGELQADWELALPELLALDLSGKRFALFGAGDAFAYPETFQDALGILGEACEARGGALFGAWPVDGYDFDASRALRDGSFIGLALDYDNQDDLNEARIATWCEQLAAELTARLAGERQLAAAASG